ncbi:ATP-binding protein [Frankia sp. AgB1.9]|uniref:ATP-binding protein n=1 Tax=unclassified Frankia TaxID=2632575 RepID=UPI0019313263|nr:MULTISPECIES: ATP-binding protein [unclassified Frankia]MBL7486528.1 ATP-binding protein [Frankia sp. AgW1.1]MBL7554055.1 ATP-binding protein [Frankia sp. AgB1.9]MBL7618253.1 ATP-binding protein [Frankia sp. AgB1.8]
MSSNSGTAVIRVDVRYFRPTLDAVPKARADIVRTLTAWSQNAPTIDTAESILCELVTNAVRVSSPTDFVAVQLKITNDNLLIEVWDSNGHAEPRIAHIDADAERGRGLFMVELLSSKWSWYRSPSGGKVVWAQIPSQPVPVEIVGGRPPIPERTSRIIIPEPELPVFMEDDPDMLRRVADTLRALHDDWQTPPPALLGASEDR